MNLVLERVQPNSALGKTASVDLFDATGILLLQKGLPITEGIKERLEQRAVYVLHNQRDLSFSKSQKVNTFPKDVYIDLVGSLWNIYHEAKLIKPEQIQKTVILVETILRELHTQKCRLLQ